MATLTNSICTNNVELDIQSKGGALKIGTLSTSTTITIGNGTGSSGIILTTGSAGTLFTGFAEGALITSNTGKVSTVTGTTGYVLTANASGTAPSFQPASGGGGGITWNDQTTTSVTMSINNAYSANNASLVTLTLPSTAIFGSLIQVSGNGAGGWIIAQNSGQTIHFGSVNTTAGVGGSLASTNRYDQVTVVCSVANTDWVVNSSLGNLTYV